ncbi:MAG: DnaJ domain-containing protein [bacterium]
MKNSYEGMKNPYKALQISPSASDLAIKEAYVRKVKEYPPERFPEEFKEIREAYEAIATPRSRVAYKLFHLEEPDPQELAGNLLASGERKRIPPKKLIDIALKEYKKSQSSGEKR